MDAIRLDCLRQVRTLSATDIIEVHCLLARAIGLDLVGPIEQLGVDAIALDQAVKPIPAAPAAFVTLDVEYVELADQVAEDDGTLARHQNHHSTRSARSIRASEN